MFLDVWPPSPSSECVPAVCAASITLSLPLTWTSPVPLLQGLLWLFRAPPADPGKSLPLKILTHFCKIPFAVEGKAYAF